MGLADDTSDGAAPELTSVGEPAETTQETVVRFIKEHPMPRDDDAPQTAEPEIATQTRNAEPASTDTWATPTLSARSVLGLDIGTRTLKLVHLQTTGAGIRVVDAMVTPIPPRSAPERSDAVAAAAQAFVADAKPKIKSACYAISGDGVATICCTMPKMSEKDLANALRWKIAEADTVDAEHSTVGYYALEKTRASGNSELVVAAAPLDIANADTLFRAAGPCLALVVSEGVAVDNVITASQQATQGGPVAVLDIGTSSARLTITGSRGLEFTRSIPVGGDTITAALAGTVTLLEGPVEISHHTAEYLKRNYTIGGGEPVEADDVVLPAGRVLAAIRPVLERLSSEIVRSVQFYGQSHELVKVEKLLICGGGATLGGLADFFTNETRIPTAVLDPWRSLDVDVPAGLDVDPTLFSAATGAAIHDRSRMNLLPPQVQARRTLSAVRTVSLITSGAMLLALACLSWTATRQAEALKAAAQQKRDSAVPMQAIAEKVATAQAYDHALGKRRAMLRELGVGRPIHAAILKELSNIMPEGTYLRSLSFGVPKGVRTVRMVVDVYAIPSANTVRLKQRLVAALEESPFFVNVSFSPLSSQASTDNRSPDETLEFSCQALGFPGD